MVAVLIAALALAFAPTGARTYTIQLDRLLAPTVNGHQIANERDAAHVFGAPTTRSRCTAAWKQATLSLNTCGIGAELAATAPSIIWAAPQLGCARWRSSPCLGRG